MCNVIMSEMALPFFDVIFGLIGRAVMSLPVFCWEPLLLARNVDLATLHGSTEGQPTLDQEIPGNLGGGRARGGLELPILEGEILEIGGWSPGSWRKEGPQQCIMPLTPPSKADIFSPGADLFSLAISCNTGRSSGLTQIQVTTRSSHKDKLEFQIIILNWGITISYLWQQSALDCCG